MGTRRSSWCAPRRRWVGASDWRAWHATNAVCACSTQSLRPGLLQLCQVHAQHAPSLAWPLPSCCPLPAHACSTGLAPSQSCPPFCHLTQALKAEITARLESLSTGTPRPSASGGAAAAPPSPPPAAAAAAAASPAAVTVGISRGAAGAPEPAPAAAPAAESTGAPVQPRQAAAAAAGGAGGGEGEGMEGAERVVELRELLEDLENYTTHVWAARSRPLDRYV